MSALAQIRDLNIRIQQQADIVTQQGHDKGIRAWEVAEAHRQHLLVVRNALAYAEYEREHPECSGLGMQT